MFNFYKKENHRLFLKYFKLFMLVLIIPTMLAYLILNIAYKYALNITIDNNYTLVNQLQESADLSLEFAQHIAFNIAANKDVLEFEYKKESNRDVYNLYCSLQNLGVYEYYSTQHSASNFIFIYFDEYDIIVTGKYKYTTKEFYNFFIEKSSLSYEDFQTLLKEKYFSELLPNISYFHNGSPVAEECITYCQSFPLMGEISGNAFVAIKSSSLDTISITSDDNDKCLYLADTEGKVVASFGNSQFIHEDLHNLSDGYTNYKINGTEALCFVKSSNIRKYKYIYVSDISNIHNKVFPLKKAIVIYVVSVLLLGIILIIILSLKAEKPLKELSDYINTITNSPRSNDVLKDIRLAVESLAQANNHSRQFLDKHALDIRESITTKILNGTIKTHDELDEFNSTSAVKLDLENGNFIVFSIDMYSEHNDNNFNLLKYELVGILREILGDIGTPHCGMTYSSGFSVLIALSGGAMSDIRQLVPSLEYTQKLFIEKVDVDISIGIGDICGFEGIPKSNQKAQKAVVYRVITGTSDIVFFDDISSKTTISFKPLSDIENTLILYINEGDMPKVQQTLNEAFMLNNASLEVNQYMFFSLIGLVLNLTNSNELDSKLQNEILENILKTRSIPELKECAIKIFSDICGRIMNKKKTKDDLKLDIMDYVNSNFSDPNMSLYFVADKFDLNYTYLSHFFKEYIGENFSKYITRMRIDKSKEYLQSTDLSVSDISSMVGYANATVLTKTFKKVTNETPAEFRRKSKRQ